jgi:hypothetical protein
MFIFANKADLMFNRPAFSLFLLLTAKGLAHADGLAIDKVYHPYVQPLEKELEWRMIQVDGEQKQQFSYGQSLSDRFYIEAYLIAENEKQESLAVSEYEIEAKWQLTEQGEYEIDWGVVAELERSRHNESWEFSTNLIMEKQWGRWVGTANLWAIYEWGDAIDNELESATALQLRYRYSRYFEPALELYTGENTQALGPVVMGDLRLGTRKKLHWETGIIFGLDNETPDHTFRVLTEFEF